MVDKKCSESYYFMGVAFHPIFNNISVMWWWSVLLVEETGVLGKYQPAASTGKTLSHNVASSAPSHERDSNSQH